jgi:hypothetical protein
MIELSVKTPDGSYKNIQFYTADAKTLVHMIATVARGQGVEV